MASKGKRLQFKVPKHRACRISINKRPQEVRQPAVAGGGLWKYTSPHPCPASTTLRERWTPSVMTVGMAACCYEASVSPHADFTGTASGWFQLSGTQDSAGVCLPGCSTPSAPGKGRPQGCGGRAKATSSEIPQPGGRAPVGPARRAEPGLPGGLFLALRQRPPLTY